jgi:putative ABC transport system permease protein
LDFMPNFIQQLQRRMPLGWLQLTQNKTQLIVALSGVAFADVLILIQLGFLGVLVSRGIVLHTKLNADIFIMSRQALNISEIYTFPRRRLYQAMDITGVQSVEAMYISPIVLRNPDTREQRKLLIVGFNPDKPQFNFPEVNSQVDKIKRPDTILFDRQTTGDYTKIIGELGAGKTVTTEIGKRTVSIGGLFSIGSSFGAEGHLMTSQDNFLRLFPSQSQSNVNLGSVEVKPGYDPKQVVVQLRAYLPSDEIKVLTKQEYIDAELTYWNEAAPVGIIFNLGAIMGFIVGIIIVYQVLSTDVNSHIREYATLKAIGYSNTYLLGIVFEEALILAIFGFVPGFVISLGFYQLVSIATSLPIAMTVYRAAQVLTLTLIMCMLSGAIATRKVQAADPADMF